MAWKDLVEAVARHAIVWTGPTSWWSRENRHHRLAAELLASDAYGSTAAQVKAFVEQGGGCRATFFRGTNKMSLGIANVNRSSRKPT